jgi:hypothetical protein
MPDAAVDVARRCGTRFRPESVPVEELPNLMRLALIAGNDAEAETAARRYVASFGDTARRLWALYDVAKINFDAVPPRMSAVEVAIARLDSLGKAAALQRLMLAKDLMEYMRITYDTTHIESHALAVLRLRTQVTGRDDEDIDARGANTTPDIFLRELHHSASLAIPRTAELVTQTGSPFANVLAPLLKASGWDWAVAQIGKPVPPLSASYWIPGASGVREWPVPGKFSLVQNLGTSCDHISLQWTAQWKRLLHKYGDALNITLICSTQGYFRNGAPLTFEQEAERIGHYVHDQLHLPATIAVLKSPLDTLPDGRRIRQPAQLEHGDYYRWQTILTDEVGKIIFIGPNASEEGIKEWIDRASARSNPMSHDRS